MASPLESLSVETHLLALTRCGIDWADAGRRLFSDSFNRIYWLESGEAQIEHNGAVHRLRRGQLHVIPANSPGRYRCVRTMNLHWCHFNARLFGGLELYDCASFPLDVKIPRRRWKEMDSLWLRLESLRSNISPKARLETASILCALLAEMAPNAGSADTCFANGRIERFKRVFERIDRRLGQQIRVGELAKLAGLQENYFTGLFKSSFGLSPMSYLKRRRLRHAQMLLKGSALSLKEIAAACGFGSECHLSAAFRSEVGMPPGAYRKKPSHELP